MFGGWGGGGEFFSPLNQRLCLTCMTWGILVSETCLYTSSCVPQHGEHSASGGQNVQCVWFCRHGRAAAERVGEREQGGEGLQPAGGVGRGADPLAQQPGRATQAGDGAGAQGHP